MADPKAHKVMHVSFVFAGVHKILDLEPVFSIVATDWIRYAANCWLIWTDKPCHEIYYLLSNFIDTADNLLVIPVLPTEFFGRLPGWAWEWLKTKNFAIDYGEHLRPYLEALMLPKPDDTK